VAVALVAVALATLIPLPHGIALAESSSTPYFLINFISKVPPIVNYKSPSMDLTFKVIPKQTYGISYYIEVSLDICMIGANGLTCKPMSITPIPTKFETFYACYESSKKEYCIEFEVTGTTSLSPSSSETSIISPVLSPNSVQTLTIKIVSTNFTEPTLVEFKVTAKTTSPYEHTVIENETGVRVLFIDTSSFYLYARNFKFNVANIYKNGYILYELSDIEPGLGAASSKIANKVVEYMYYVCLWTGTSQKIAYCAFRSEYKPGIYHVENTTVTASIVDEGTTLAQISFTCPIYVTSSGSSYQLEFPSKCEQILKLNTSSLEEDKLKILEEHPNATIKITFTPVYGIQMNTSPGNSTWVTVLAYKTPEAKVLKVESGSGLPAKERENIYYIASSTKTLNIELAVRAYAYYVYSKKTKSYYSECYLREISKKYELFCMSRSKYVNLTKNYDETYVNVTKEEPKVLSVNGRTVYNITVGSETELSKITPFKLVEVCVNKTCVSSGEELNLVNMSESDLSGLQTYMITVTVGKSKSLSSIVPKIKYKTNITIVLKEKYYNRKFKITIFVAKETTKPGAPTFKLLKEGPFTVGVYDINASDMVGILYYKVYMPSGYAVEIPVNMINMPSVSLYYGYYNKSAKAVEYGYVNYTACLVNVTENCIEALANLSKYGGVLVGFGKIIIIPPADNHIVQVKISAINYGANEGPASTVEINYGTDRYDAYYILYLAKGWNIFALPGVLPAKWNTVFLDIVKQLHNEGLLSTLWCATPGPLVAVSPCSVSMLMNPVPMKMGIITPYVFFARLTEKLNDVYVIPFKFKVLKPSPYLLMEVVEGKADVWNAIPIVLTTGGTLKEIISSITKYATVVFFVYRPLSPSVILRVEQSKPYLLPGEVVFGTSTLPFTIQIVAPS
jgi:hypothetical protein